MKPEIALVAPAIRHEYWLDCHAELTAKTTIPFCMIFVGPENPGVTFPDNLMFIQSDMKPAACLEIGYTVAYSMPSLRYIMNGNDDAYMFSDRFLDYSVYT